MKGLVALLIVRPTLAGRSNSVQIEIIFAILAGLI
jgi:hypothetical protein